MDEEPEIGLRGGGGIGPGEGGSIGVVLAEKDLEHTGEPTLQDVREALIAVDGTDYGAHSPRWISRFTDMTRQAASYRKETALPCSGRRGSRASPTRWPGPQCRRPGCSESRMEAGPGGQGDITRGHPGHLSRREGIRLAPCALQNTLAQGALRRTDERTHALRDTITELLKMDEPRKRFAAMMSGLDIHYDLGEGHPLLGRRMPDLDLETADGPLRVFTLLHGAQPVLLNLVNGSLDITPWADRVQLIDAEHVGPWEVPVLGVVTDPTAVLIRPDGYVAWVGDGTETGLPEALATWFEHHDGREAPRATAERLRAARSRNGRCRRLPCVVARPRERRRLHVATPSSAPAWRSRSNSSGVQ